MPATKRDRRDAKIIGLEKAFAAAERALGERLADVKRLTGELELAARQTTEMEKEIERLKTTVHIITAQRDDAKGHFIAMAERFWGLKASTGDVCFEKAKQALDRDVCGMASRQASIYWNTPAVMTNGEESR